jgi:translocation and assembly module TamB
VPARSLSAGRLPGADRPVAVSGAGTGGPGWLKRFLVGADVLVADQGRELPGLAGEQGLEVGGAVLAKPINKQLEATGFNLSVTSQYDSTRNISVPKITLSRKMTDKVKLSGSRQVGDVTGYDVKLEYLLNPNWTAVGSFENKSLYDNNTLQNTPQESESIFGLDLEFKREFK